VAIQSLLYSFKVRRSSSSSPRVSGITLRYIFLFKYPGAWVGLKVAKDMCTGRTEQLLRQRSTRRSCCCYPRLGRCRSTSSLLPLQVAIRCDRNEVIISHNEEFVNALCQHNISLHRIRTNRSFRPGNLAYFRRSNDPQGQGGRG
jgi:hypothetical protein